MKLRLSELKTIGEVREQINDAEVKIRRILNDIIDKDANKNADYMELQEICLKLSRFAPELYDLLDRNGYELVNQKYWVYKKTRR